MCGAKFSGKLMLGESVDWLDVACSSGVGEVDGAVLAGEEGD